MEEERATNGMPGIRRVELATSGLVAGDVASYVSTANSVIDILQRRYLAAGMEWWQ